MNHTSGLAPGPTAETPLPVLARADWPDVSQLVTEDDTPVDNFFSETLMRLLVEVLWNSWPGPGEGRPFLAMANVGLFFAVHQPPFVPDVLLSLDVRPPADLWQKEHRSYFVWMYGKVPDVVIEIVSNREGGEDTTKLQGYARLGILYYVIYDPLNLLGGGELRVFGLLRGRYDPVAPNWLPEVGLGLTVWQGTYESKAGAWLRWCDRDGRLLPTGAERAEAERQRAEAAEQQLHASNQRLRDLEAELRRLQDEAKPPDQVSP